MNKIKKYFLNLWYSLPFAMKAGDAQIFGEGASEGDAISITKEVQDSRVAKHLLKGEVTVPVEELRYRTYKVSNESEKYGYIGDGQAMHKEKTDYNNQKRHKFYQDNGNICETILETFKQVDRRDLGFDKYRLEIDYEYLVKFKLEKYATSIFVDIDDDANKIETTLNFSILPDPYDVTSKAFINELEKLTAITTEAAASRNEIASTIQNIAFTTYHPSNEDEFVNYCFINKPKFVSCKKTKDEYQILFSWDEYMRVPLNLEAKYFSKTMAEKYAKHERKDSAISISQMERKAYCSVCGKEVSIYDADIQSANGQPVLCQDCLRKALNNE